MHAAAAAAAAFDSVSRPWHREVVKVEQEFFAYMGEWMAGEKVSDKSIFSGAIFGLISNNVDWTYFLLKTSRTNIFPHCVSSSKLDVFQSTINQCGWHDL